MNRSQRPLFELLERVERLLLILVHESAAPGRVVLTVGLPVDQNYKGEVFSMADFQLQDSQKVPYAISEVDAKGNIDTPDAQDSATLTSSDTASITIVPDTTVDPAKVPNNPDGTPGDPTKYLQTGFIVAGSKLQTGVTVTVTVNHGDGQASPPPTVDTFDIVGGTPTTTVITLGTPVSQ